MVDYNKYRLHFELLSYRDGSHSERLSTLRFDIIQPTTTICGFTDVLKLKIESNSSELIEFISQLNSICRILRRLREESQLESDASEIHAEELLQRYWENKSIADQVRSVASELTNLPDPLIPDFGDNRFWQSSLIKAAEHIEADIEVLARPNEVLIPKDIIDAHNLLRQFHQIKVNDENYLLSLLTLIAHPLDKIRHRVAILLRHYDDHRSKLALIELLGDSSEEVVADASNSIAYLKCYEALDALIECLDRDFKTPAYIGWIAEALAQIPDPKALHPLITTLDSSMKRGDIQRGPMTLPIAGVRKAIEAIGGSEADDALKRYVG